MRKRVEQSSNRCDIARCGTAAVEFAVVVPLFMTLVLGVIEMGSAIDAAVNMTAALREGGRLAGMEWGDQLELNQTINEKVELDIRNMLRAVGIPADDDVMDIEITYAEGPSEGAPFDMSDPANNLELFRISTSIDYEDISLFPVNFMEGRTVERSLVFRLGKVELVD